MAKSVSIAISAKDSFSNAIVTMRNISQAFTKDLNGLQTKLDALNRNRVTLKVEVDKAKQALKDAEAQFKKTGDAADKMALEIAGADYEQARRNLDLLSKNARQVEKDMLNMTSAISKAENRAGSGSSDGMMARLGASGAAAYLGQVGGQLATSYVGSAFGSEAGSYFSGALSGAGMGAAIGSAIGGPIGTAVGAALGGIVGLVQGAIQVFEKKDDAFKEYYQEQYARVTEEQKATLERGTGIAAMREQKMISFTTLLEGEQNAARYLGEMTEFASKTPFSYETLADISQTLLAYGYTQNELLPLLTKVGDAGAALSMSTDDMVRIATGLGRMQTSGKTTLEYLNPLLERGIPVWDYLAEASGKTKEEVQEMVSKGLVPGAEAAKAIADYMGASFSGSMEKQARTYSGLLSTLEDAQAELDNAMGRGYTETRKQGLQEKVDWMEGESGAMMQEAYFKIGQYQASLENTKERMLRESLDAAMRSSEYQAYEAQYNEALKLGDEKAMAEAAADQGRILAEARAHAENEYNASEGAQILLESQRSLADNLKNDAILQDKYWDAGYVMGEQFSKGMAAAQIDTGLNLNSGTPNPFDRPSAYTGHAYGLEYVPYDNFPALLHEGERVLTASEARGYGSGVTVQVSGNTFSIREDADIERVARALAREISRAKMLAVND